MFRILVVDDDPASGYLLQKLMKNLHRPHELHVAKDGLDIQGQLHLGSRYCPQRGLRATLHFGGSFLCLLGTRMFTCGRKEPPPSAHRFNSFWDIAQCLCG